MAGFKWIVPPDLAFPELVERFSKTIFVTGSRVVEERAPAMEQWAKDNAPWTDRTGAARAGLHVTVDKSGPLAQITLAHGDNVPYGVWLEIANGGKYAIIALAIDVWAPIIWRDMQRIINLKVAAKQFD